MENFFTNQMNPYEFSPKEGYWRFEETSFHKFLAIIIAPNKCYIFKRFIRVENHFLFCKTSHLLPLKFLKDEWRAQTFNSKALNFIFRGKRK